MILWFDLSLHIFPPFWFISNVINPFKPNGISHYYQSDQSISILRVVGLYFSFLLKF